MTIKSNSQGECPVCAGLNLSYGTMDLIDDGVAYPWECEDCGATGREVYDLVFDGHYRIRDDKGGYEDSASDALESKNKPNNRRVKDAQV